MATPRLGLTNDYVAGDPYEAAQANAVADAVDQALRSDHLATSVAGSGDLTLAVAEYDGTSLEFTGTLTGARNVILPLTPGCWWAVFNNTSGAYELTVKGASGSGVVVTQGRRALVLCDGTDFYTIPNDDDEAIRTVTSSGSVTPDDKIVRGDATGGAITLTLPTAVGRGGKAYTFKKIDASGNAVNIASTGGQTFDGAASPLVLAAQYDSVMLYSTGANWELRGS